MGKVEGYESCPHCGRSLEDRVLLEFVDNTSEQKEYVCISEEFYDKIREMGDDFGINEERMITFILELFAVSRIIRGMEKRYRIYYEEIINLLNSLPI